MLRFRQLSEQLAAVLDPDTGSLPVTAKELRPLQLADYFSTTITAPDHSSVATGGHRGSLASQPQPQSLKHPPLEPKVAHAHPPN